VPTIATGPSTLPDAGSQAQAKSHRTANAIAASDVSAVVTTVVAPADTRANTMATRMKSLRMIEPPFRAPLWRETRLYTVTGITRSRI
jgi:hypothetical protein